MAGQRITRDTFDAVVQEKMKRYRISMDQAIANTVREFQLEGPSKMGSYDPLFRDQERLSFRDLPRDPLSRKWDSEMRRDSVSNPLYYRELGRDSSSGLLSDPLLDRWGSVDPILKERLYREELLARDLDLSRRKWELERNTLSGPELGMGRSDVYRELRASHSLELDPVKEVFRAPGQGPVKSTRGMFGVQGPSGQHLSSGGLAGKAGETSSKKHIPQKKHIPVGDNEFSEQIVTWAKFNKVKSDSDLVRQHKALFKVETETCKMILNCFKGRLSVYHTELCFSSLKPISHPALNSPKIDNDLLDLLVASKTVTVKNDFFDAIKPFDKEMMILQQRLLKCATPLLLACNTFELKQPILTDPKQLLGALDNTMFLARKSLVLLGQTFALATALRQNNVMEILGISGTDLKPSQCTNFKDSFLFGKEFISKLKDWLRKSGHKLILKSRTILPKETTTDNKEETKTEPESKEITSADPNVVATIDQLLEYAKKGDKGEEERPAFWFLFDKNSNEYKYYHQKLEQFHNSASRTKNAQSAKAKKSPEDLAVESVRAMLYARKALAVKRKLFGSLASSRKRKGIKPLRRLSTTMKASKKRKQVGKKVGKKNTTLDMKKETVTQEVKDNVTPAVLKEAAKKEAATPVVKEAAVTPAVKEAAVTPAVKEAAVTPAVKKGAATPAVKKEAATPAVKREAATPAVKAATPAAKKEVAKKVTVTPAVKKQTAVKPVQDASTKQPSSKAEIKGQEVQYKRSTGTTSKLLKTDQPSDVKALTSEEPQDSDVDEKTKDTAIKLAQFVIQMGPEIEEFSMQNSVNNPDFWFLREKDSPAYKYYRSKLEEFKQEEATSDDGELEDVKTGDEDVEMSGEATSADSTSVAAFSQMPTPSRPPILRKRVAKLKVGMLPPKRVCLVNEPQVHDPVRIDYERPKGRGQNRRKKPADLEFTNKKLTQQNVGFQMLSKMGWREGQGLGSSGSGIKNPIKVGAVSAGEGLGVELKDPAQSRDFDAFRQRMMNMYKQKISK